jgi:hypothetical protein
MHLVSEYKERHLVERMAARGLIDFLELDQSSHTTSSSPAPAVEDSLD